MMQRSEWQLERGMQSSRRSAPPALLFQIQMGTKRTRSQSPRKPKLTSQHTHGSRRERANIPSCDTLSRVSPRRSNSLKSTPSTLKEPSDPSSMIQIAQNFQTQSGRTLSLVEQSTSTLSSADNSPQRTMTSVLKSGPVRFLALQGLRPRPRPVHVFQKRKKTRPRPQKTEDRGLLQF